ALKTAAIVAEAINRPIHIERGIRERNFGSFDGLIVRKVKARHGLPPDQNSRSIMPADADSWDEIFERVPPVIARWMTKHAGEALLFVAHGGPSVLTGQDPSRTSAVRFCCAAATDLIW